MYLYESHMGGLYLTDWQQDWDDLYCEECGDSDWELGQVETYQDVLDLVTDEDGFIPWVPEIMDNIRAQLEAAEEEE